MIAEMSPGAQAAAFTADVTSPEQVEQLIASVDASFGGLDTLINNAGLDGARASCADSSVAEWQKVLAADAIRLFAIVPGAIKTPINADVWGDPDSVRDLDGKIAMGRPGEPDEIGRVAAFLVSDLASYITGTTLAVDGGMVIYPDFAHGADGPRTAGRRRHDSALR